jgi:hypothetical protein
MSDIYAMRRANGDWFALEDRGRIRVPLFHSSHDAMMARLRNFGMLLFKPVALDAHFLKEIVPVGGGTDVDFCIVNDPLAGLNRGCLVEHAQLALLVSNPEECQIVPRNGNSSHAPGLGTLRQSDSEATEGWENEGGRSNVQTLRASPGLQLLKELPGGNT